MNEIRYLRLNQIAIDFKQVECIEWKKIDEESFSSEEEYYSLRFHLKSGKMFTRQVNDNQFEIIKEKYKEMLGDE